MSFFTKKTWKDRISDFPFRRTITHADSTQETVTVARNEGNITENGDKFNATNMNSLETRIENGFNTISDIFAPAEDDPTSASQSYAVGDHLITNNKYYKVIDNIAKGDALVDTGNTPNIEEANIGEEISEVNNDLIDKVNAYSGTDSGNTYVTVDSIGYDLTKKKLGLKVNGADTVIPFSSTPSELTIVLTESISTSNAYATVKIPNDGYSKLDYKQNVSGRFVRITGITSGGTETILYTGTPDANTHTITGLSSYTKIQFYSNDSNGTGNTLTVRLYN